MRRAPTRSLYCNQTELEVAAGGIRFRNDPTMIKQVALGKVARTWTLLWIMMRALGPSRRAGRASPIRARSI